MLPVPGRAVIERAGLRLRERDEFAHRGGRHIGVDDERERACRDRRDRRELPDRVVARRTRRRGDRRERSGDEQQRVAVGRRLRRLDGADRPAGAGAIVDDDRDCRSSRRASARRGGRRCRCPRPAETGRSAGPASTGTRRLRERESRQRGDQRERKNAETCVSSRHLRRTSDQSSPSFLMTSTLWLRPLAFARLTFAALTLAFAAMSTSFQVQSSPSFLMTSTLSIRRVDPSVAAPSTISRFG